jgi:flagellar capping protein FliD
MKRQPDPRWQLMGVSLLMAFTLSACGASKTENGSIKERVAKLSSQIAELTKKTDDLASRIRKDQAAKDARLATIENQIEDLNARLKK